MDPLKKAYENASRIASINRELGQADQPDSHLGGIKVDPREVTNAAFFAREDGYVSKSEKIALAQGWDRVAPNAAQDAKDAFEKVSNKYGLGSPQLLTAKPPASLDSLDESALKGDLKAFFTENGPNGGGSLDVSSFKYKNDTYYVVDIEGEFNRDLAIGTPDGTIVFKETEKFND